MAANVGAASVHAVMVGVNVAIVHADDECRRTALEGTFGLTLPERFPGTLTHAQLAPGGAAAVRRVQAPTTCGRLRQ